MTEEYQPQKYWSGRLEGEFSLRGTGHAGYSTRYNDWVYRRKGIALGEALSYVPSHGFALDIGSGTGWVVEELLNHGLRVEGCDITNVAVERLAAQFGGASFFQADVGDDPLPREPATYDLITMLDVAYHITDYGLWRAAIEDFGRLLKPGGFLIVSDQMAGEPEQVAAHVQFRSRSEWISATENAGMRLTQISPLYRWLSRPRELPGWRLLPDEARGAVEFLLDRHLQVGEPVLRLASFVKIA